MSNTNTIFAIAADSKLSATSFDGSSWILKMLPGNQSWKMIGGSIGKFAYYISDPLTPFSTQITTISDNVHWKVGSLPTAQTLVTVALADGESALYISTDGSTFTAATPPTFIYAQTCTAVSVSNSFAAFVRNHTNVVYYLSVVAVSTSNAVRTTKTVICRTYSALVTSAASLINRTNSI
jgi:hypothetical protein